MKWHSYEDDDFMRQTVHTLAVDSSSPYHSVKVFSSKKIHPVAMLKRTQHTAQVCCGAYGETVYEVDLPFGTKLAEAKAKAVAMAQEANSKNLAEFPLTLPSLSR